MYTHTGTVQITRARICKPFLRSPGIDCQPDGPVRQPYCICRVPARHASKAGGIGSLESIPVHLKRLQIRTPGVLGLGTEAATGL
jgi:hypothetical protein